MHLIHEFDHWEVDLLRFIGDAKVFAVFEDDWKVYKVFREAINGNEDLYDH